MHVRSLIVGWIACWALGGVAHARAPARIAIVIGQNQPRTDSLATLRFADDDAARFTRLFDTLGFQTRLLTVMDDETHRRHPALSARARLPSLHQVETAFADANRLIEAAHAAGRRADLVFIYAGHGEQTAAGGGRLHLQDGYLSRKAMLALLRASRADFNHVIIDACHASSMVFGRGDGYTAREFGPTIKRYLASEDTRDLPNTGVLLAASSSQETHEWSTISSGVFSHEVRSALSGAADINGDGLVEYSEVAAYVAAANASIAVVATRPAVVIEAPRLDRNRPLVDVVSDKAAYLRLPMGWTRRAWLEDEEGIRHADLHPAGDTASLIALAPDRRWFLRTQTSETRLVVARNRVTSPDDGAWRPTSLRSRGAVADAYHSGLFAEPFGAAFYRGYLAQARLAPARARRPTPSLDAVSYPTDLSPWAWSSGGVAVASGLAAALTGAWASADYDRFEQALGRTGQDDPALRSRINDLQGWSNGLAAVGVAAGVTALVLFMLDDDEAEAAPRGAVELRGGF